MTSLASSWSVVGRCVDSFISAYLLPWQLTSTAQLEKVAAELPRGPRPDDSPIAFRTPWLANSNVAKRRTDKQVNLTMTADRLFSKLVCDVLRQSIALQDLAGC